MTGEARRLLSMAAERALDLWAAEEAARDDVFRILATPDYLALIINRMLAQPACEELLRVAGADTNPRADATDLVNLAKAILPLVAKDLRV